MKNRFKLIRLILIGNRKNYPINFKDGINYISGHTSTGKTSILEMIDYALGSKGHKDYIEIGNNCTEVELEFKIGEEQFKIKRKLFDFNSPVIVEDWNKEKSKYLFFNRYDIDAPSNKNSLSAFLVEKLGLADFTIIGQTFSFRDLFKYSYLKQTEIDNENILGEKDWAKDKKRKATFEIIFNIYDKMLEELKASQKKKEDEVSELNIRLAAVNDFIANTDFINIEKYNDTKKVIETEIKEKQKKLSALKEDNGVDTGISRALRDRVIEIKQELERLGERKNDQAQYISRLRLLANQYQSEISKKEMALEGYNALNQYEFLFCPNCLKPITITNSVDNCCLCGSEKSEDISELIILKRELSSLKRKTNEVFKFIDKEDTKYDDILKEQNQLQSQLTEAEIELQHLYKDYVNPHIEQIEMLNYDIGKNNRLLFELDQNLKMLEEVERLAQLIKSKNDVIKNLKDNIKAIKENSTDKQELIRVLSNRFTNILEAFNFPKLSASYIDKDKYLPYVRNRKYNDIGSLAGVTLTTMAYYLAILLEACTDEHYHLNLLIIDTPRKNLGAKADQEEFKDEKIFNSIIKHFLEVDNVYKDKLQLIIVNNGYPDFLPKDCIVAEFDEDGARGLPYGLIDDAN